MKDTNLISTSLLKCYHALRTKLIEGCTPELYVCGDFNIPHTISHNYCKPSKNCNNKLVESFNNFSAVFNLNQIIQKPTHSSGNILDFLLTNNDENITMIAHPPYILITFM